MSYLAIIVLVLLSIGANRWLTDRAAREACAPAPPVDPTPPASLAGARLAALSELATASANHVRAVHAAEEAADRRRQAWDRAEALGATLEQCLEAADRGEEAGQVSAWNVETEDAR